jgi:hypothetical protein
MKKGNIVTLEGRKDEVKLLHSIGKKDSDGQFWEVEFENGDQDIMLLKEISSVQSNEAEKK